MYATGAGNAIHERAELQLALRERRLRELQVVDVVDDEVDTAANLVVAVVGHDDAAHPAHRVVGCESLPLVDDPLTPSRALDQGREVECRVGAEYVGDRVADDVFARQADAVEIGLVHELQAVVGAQVGERLRDVVGEEPDATLGFGECFLRALGFIDVGDDRVDAEHRPLSPKSGTSLIRTHRCAPLPSVARRSKSTGRPARASVVSFRTASENATPRTSATDLPMICSRVVLRNSR
jgi:hypothetical protein